VDASFVDSNPGCIFTSAYVLASEDSFIPGNPGNQTVANIYVILSRFNNCTGEAFYASSYQQFTASSFQVSPSLGTATLNVNTTAIDYYSGASIDVVVALAWTATEGVVSGHSNYRSRIPGYSIHQRLSGTTRAAEATGTITALGMNFALSPSYFADISKSNSGSVVVTH
jgi:hypothetical protein